MRRTEGNVRGTQKSLVGLEMRIITQKVKSWSRALGAFTLITSALPLSAQSQNATRPTSLSNDVKGVSDDLNALENDFETLPKIFDRLEPEVWARRAQIARASGQYDAASMLYFAAVEAPEQITTRKSSGEEYAASVYGLAQSLFENQNWKASQTYFDVLLNSKNHQHHDEALMRLVEIALKLQEFKNVVHYYKTYKRVVGRPMPAEVGYAIGRSLFLDKRDKQARSRLQKIPQGNAFYLRAQYILASIMLRSGDVKGALEHFTRLLNEEKTIADEDVEVRELITLAVARLRYELGDIDSALDMYQDIGIDSKYLSEMLYESVWAQVHRAGEIQRDESISLGERERLASLEYSQAIERLGYLKYLEEDPIRSAENEVLRGNLQVMQGDTDGARQSYTAVIDTYRNATDSLKKILANSASQARVLDEILALESNSAGGLGQTSLPPVAAKFAMANPEVSKAVAIYRQLQNAETEIEDAQSAWGRIASLLERDDRGQLFPGIGSAYQGAFAIDMRLVILEGNLLSELRKSARAKVPDGKRSEASKLKAATEGLRQEMQANLLTGDALKNALEGWNSELTNLDQDLAKLRLELKNFEQTIRVLDEELHYQREKLARDPVMVEKIRREIQYWAEQHQMMEWAQEELNEQIRWERQTLRVNEGRGSYQQKLRNRYRIALEAEESFLKQYGVLPSNLESKRRELRALRDRNIAFRNKVDGLVNQQLSGFSDVLNTEKDNIESYRKGLAKVHAETDQFKRETTRVALTYIQTHLEDMIIRGDAGMLEVLWREKQKNTEQISELQRSQSNAMMLLEQTYQELSSEDI